MRIVSGTLGGRLILAPSGHLTHPMSEKMRAAIFSVLGDIANLSVLDAYCGSGAIAFEAYSRHAGKIIAIDNSRQAAEIFQTNLNMLGIKDNIKFVNLKIENWLKYNKQRLDIIIADPPYDKLNIATLELMSVYLNEQGIFVLSWPMAQQLPTLSNLFLIKQKTYGDSQLGFYSRQN